MGRETVITHLQIIHTWADFARERDLNFFTAKHLEDIAQWTDDALNLLKEQEQDRIEIAHEMVSNSILMYQGKKIVRCKDCKHYKPYTGRVSGNQYFQCEEMFMDTEPNWFCADGEGR